ncbi:hypothetical protein SARC_02736 [Sphaeroforma arctica JP610]|uniref:Uncharacterized protein n=1 Tax=Sphaeroforma arctica JP610 TaxID=667725 RepID=A0A0L0G880_9EUKA|nr:hypothetical protein SARC_02736 [Sphaeroforma arctica JP610]KNC85076.1 hypothetical protein SARC_02736 [Sphaeroforma arctica JP610]|eukprot:XP_014158978.1 hypothetical protein SARC_02736 [Sphaeroforma arctica JP610]
MVKNREEMRFAFCRICPIHANTKPIRYYNPSNLAQHLRKQKFMTPDNPHTLAYEQVQMTLYDRSQGMRVRRGTATGSTSPDIHAEVARHDETHGHSSLQTVDTVVPMWELDDMWTCPAFSKFTPGDLVSSNISHYTKYFILLKDPETGDRYAACRICPLSASSKKLKVLSQSNLRQHLYKRNTEHKRDYHRVAYDLVQRDMALARGEAAAKANANATTHAMTNGKRHLPESTLLHATSLVEPAAIPGELEDIYVCI